MTSKYNDLDYSLQISGPHYIDPKHKKPGYSYCLVGNLPGQIEKYQRIGYEVVKDDSIKVGQDKPSVSHSFGSAVTIQSKCGQLMVLMAVPNEIKEKIDSLVKEKIESTNQAMGKVQGIPTESLYGEVKFTEK